MSEPTSIKKNNHTETCSINFGGRELKLTITYSLGKEDNELMEHVGPEYTYAFSKPETCVILHTDSQGNERSIKLDAEGIAQLLRLLGKTFPRSDERVGYMVGKRGMPPGDPLG